MLERAKMYRYLILEKSPKIRPQGSAIVLNAIVLRCFEQMGFLHEVIAVSKPTHGNVFLDEDLNLIGQLSSAYFSQRYGYSNVVLSRPDFHEILHRHVPAHKILYSKKVLSLDQTSDLSGPQIHCSDNSVYTCDIVVGADGAYSGVRQSLYRSIQPIPKRVLAKLESQGLTSKSRWSGHTARTSIPESDQESLRVDQHAVIGITEPLDPDKYQILKEKSSTVTTIINKKGFTAWLLPIAKNQMCWGLASKRFGTPSEQGQELPANFRVSEWGPETVNEILKLDHIKTQKLPFGGTMQELFDKTKQGNAGRIMLEDKAFKTWYHKRTVLIGDACHKTIPFSGMGTLHAILDCILLVNALYDMPDEEDFSSKDITRAFKMYYAQRFESASAAVKASAQVSQFLGGTGTWGHWLRSTTLSNIPESVVIMASDRVFANRPLLNFLPSVPDHGTKKSLPQRPSRRDREALKRMREEERQRRKEEKETGRRQCKKNKLSIHPPAKDRVEKGDLQNQVDPIHKAILASSSVVCLAAAASDPSSAPEATVLPSGSRSRKRTRSRLSSLSSAVYAASSLSLDGIICLPRPFPPCSYMMTVRSEIGKTHSRVGCEDHQTSGSPESLHRSREALPSVVEELELPCGCDDGQELAHEDGSGCSFGSALKVQGVDSGMHPLGRDSRSRGLERLLTVGVERGWIF
ncbi:hypothetical protein BGX34_005253 [Mortierella sp. NVP85]|nr:hypothetical protein BGX34_005253 [Mortierella sp. NVP85]